MDSGGEGGKLRNGSKIKGKPFSPTGTEEEETDLLLEPKQPPAPAIGNGRERGGLARKKRDRERGSRRRVQWNDRNGNKLVEALKFLPRNVPGALTLHVCDDMGIVGCNIFFTNVGSRKIFAR